MSGRALVLAVALLAVPAAARQTIGVYKSWGAFRDPDRCYAIAQPVLANGRPGGFATVGTWPAKRLRASFHLHLSAPLVRAMGSGRSMSVSAVDTRHRPFADTYALAGAAAAIDAATLACVAGNPG